MTINWTRRDFLRALGCAGAAAPLLSWTGCASEDAMPPALLVSATDDATGGHFITGYAVDTGMAYSTPVPFRCHAAALHPSAPLVALVARRPGTELYVVDVADGTVVHTIASVSERHFLGHGVYDARGELLYVAENVYDDAAVPDLTPRDAVLGVYDARAGYARLGELPTHGVGAHEVARARDGVLVIANGGIYTHPAFPRDSLNIDTMDPSLVYIDAATGALLEQHRPDDPLLSVRHLSVGEAGVAIGMQYQGAAATRVPLVATHGGAGAGAGLAPLTAPDSEWDALDHYIASVVVHPESGAIAATSPVGGRLALWTADGSYAGAIEAADISGLAAAGSDFVATTGTGDIHVIDAWALDVRATLRAGGARWDNHLTASMLS